MSKTVQIQSGLAGALAMAAGSAAYGAIVVVTPPANIPNAAEPATNPASGLIPWDVDGNGTNDFGFSYRNPQANPGDGVQWQANMNPTPANGINAIAGYAGPFINYGTPLNMSDSIGGSLPSGVSWRNQSQVTLGSFYRYFGLESPYGGFATGAVDGDSVVRGFVGFRFNIGGNTHYGWLDVEVRGTFGPANTGGIFFFGAAYESTPNTPIAAGAVPAPGTLAGLAIGAAGMLRRKRRAS